MRPTFRVALKHPFRSWMETFGQKETANMEPNERIDVPSIDSSDPAPEGISRRRFVERLRRSAIVAAPLVATLTLMTPKACGD